MSKFCSLKSKFIVQYFTVRGPNVEVLPVGRKHEGQFLQLQTFGQSFPSIEHAPPGPSSQGPNGPS